MGNPESSRRRCGHPHRRHVYHHPGTVQLGAFFDRIFVNSFGLPINSGITFYAFALLALLAWASTTPTRKEK